jgi:uncharacterized protein involved in exopolysaccharide biosynthesis
MTAARTSDSRAVLRDALGVMFKRKRLILGLFLVVALGISFAVLSLPASYEVTGKLVVTRSRGDVLVTPSDNKNFNFTVTAPTAQDMAVHAEMLKNRSLLEAVAKKLDLERRRSEANRGANPSLMSLGQVFALIPERFQGWFPWSGPAGDSREPAVRPARARLDGIVDGMSNALAVQVIPNSNLLLVRYRGTDGQLSAEILNTLLEMYLDRYLDLRRHRGVTDFFTTQRDRLGESLRTSEGTLKSFTSRTGLLSANVQVDAYARRLAEAENQSVDAEYDLREVEQRIAIIQTQIAGEPVQVQRSSSTKYNPMIPATEEKLLQLEMQRERLLTLYTDNDRRVTDITREIEALRQKLSQYKEWVPESEVTETNQTRKDLEDKLRASQLALMKQKIRVEGARAIAAEMRRKVAEIAQQQVDKETMIRDIQANAEAYLLYRKKVEEARISEAMDDNRIMNVTIAEMASQKGVPVGPPKNLSLLFAVMVGLVSGLGGAFLREFFDSSIKSEREVRAAIDVPVLGSIPEEKNGKNGNGHARNGNGNGKNGNGNGKHGNGRGGNGHH